MTPKELIDCSERLIQQRQEWDKVWSAISRYVLPMQDRFWNTGTPASATTETFEGWAAGPRSADKLGERYDVTGLIGIERLATGLLSLATPDNEKWQDLDKFSLFGEEASDGEKRWMEKQRDYLFKVRYNPLCGWALANKFAIRSMCAFGCGFYLIEESYGGRGGDQVVVPYRFSPLPLSENYFTVDGQGNLDQDYRRFKMSARALAGLPGFKVSAKTLAKANDPKKQHEMVEVLHYVAYRQESGYKSDPNRTSKVTSVYIEVEEKHELKQGGFSYWPIVGYHWNQVPHSPYGEGPVMLVLSEIKGTNLNAKNALLSMQQITAPPIATSEDLGQKPNLNPRAINYGALTPSGELKIKPLLTAQNPSLVVDVLNQGRDVIKDGLYLNLWQILINDPNMTATQALIRANEKGELLGPIGSNIERGLSNCTDAELDIIKGKGAWEPGSALAPPESMLGSGVQTVFDSPLSRLRRSSEMLGIERTLMTAGQLAQMGRTDVLDRIDADAILETAQEVNGAPRKMLKPAEEVMAMREQRAREEQMAKAMQAAGAAAQVGADATKALPAVGALAQMTGNKPVQDAANQNAA